MDDLNSISNALNQVIQDDHEGSSYETFAQLVESYLSNDDPEVRLAAVQALSEILNGNVDEESASDSVHARRNHILQDTALTFIPLILPLLSQSRFNVNVQTILHQTAVTSRPREVVLALNEGLSSIEEQAQGVEVSDDEDEDEDMARAGDGDVDWDALVSELEVILECYSRVIPRMPNTKSTPTLLSLSDALKPVLSIISPHTPPDDARAILAHLVDLMRAVHQWVGNTADKGGEQDSIISELVFMSMTFFAPRMSARLFERYFLATRPRFAGLHPTTEEERASQVACIETLKAAEGLLADLGVDHTKLLDLLIHPRSTSPFAPFASLHLLVGRMSNDHAAADPAASGGTGRSDEGISPTLLSDSMPVLSAALSGTAIDAGLIWVNYLVDGGVDVPYDAATLLLELIVPLAANPPNPTAQTALLKLLEAIIQAARAEDQVLLIKQLIEPDIPFDQIRVQGLSILRQVTLSAVRTKSPFLSPTIVYVLFPVLFTLPPRDTTTSTSTSSFPAAAATGPQDLDPLTSPIHHLLSTLWPTWFTECANYLWFLLDIDRDDRTGLKGGSGDVAGAGAGAGAGGSDGRSDLRRIKKDWLEVLVKRVGELRLELGQPEPYLEGDSAEAIAKATLSDADTVSGAAASARGTGPGHQMSHQGMPPSMEVFEAHFVLDKWGDALARGGQAVDSALGDNLGGSEGP